MAIHNSLCTWRHTSYLKQQSATQLNKQNKIKGIRGHTQEMTCIGALKWNSTMESIIISNPMRVQPRLLMQARQWYNKKILNNCTKMPP